jgi:hypothetical protein
VTTTDLPEELRKTALYYGLYLSKNERLVPTQNTIDTLNRAAEVVQDARALLRAVFQGKHNSSSWRLGADQVIRRASADGGAQPRPRTRRGSY